MKILDRAAGTRGRAVAVGAALGALLGLLASLILPTSYQAKTTLLLSSRSDGGIVRGEQRLDLVTELEVARSRDVKAAAEEELGFRPFIDVQQVKSSATIEFRAQAPTPAESVAAARRYAETFIQVRREQVQRPLRQLRDELGKQVQALSVLTERSTLSPAELRVAIAAIDDPQLARELGLLEATTPGDAERSVAVATLRLAVLQRKLDETDVALRAVAAGEPIVISQPRTPKKPTTPKTALNVLLGALTGAALGLTVSVLRGRRPSAEEIDSPA